MPFFFASFVVLSAFSAASMAATPKATPKPPLAPLQAPTVVSSPKPTAGGAPVLAPTSVAPKVTSVTRVVGEAGDRVITSREVRLNHAIAQTLAKEPSKKILALEDSGFPLEVLKVLDEWTVYLESIEVGTKLVDEAEIARLAKAVGEYWKGDSNWERLEAAPSEIRDILARKLAAQSLEKLKGDTSLVTVTDAEALQYFKKNRLRFGNLPFENFKDNIKAALIKNQTERRLGEWRAVLRRKYRVRNFVGA